MFQRKRQNNFFHTGYVTAAFAAVAVMLLLLSNAANANDSMRSSDGPQDAPSSSPDHLVVMGNTLAFSADDVIHGRELWIRDTDGLPILVKDIWPGPPSSDPRCLTPIGSRLYFVADSDEAGTELWVWDSVDNSIKMLGETLPGPALQLAAVLGADRKALYFITNNQLDLDLWAVAIDSTTPTKLLDLTWKTVRSSYSSAISPDGNLVLHLQDRVLWQAEGAKKELERLAETPCYPGDSGSMCFLRERLVFSADRQDISASELWSFDVTSKKVALLKDINPSRDSECIGGLFPHAGAAYFKADDGKCGFELWKTDGSPEGTLLLQEINPGVTGSDPHYFCEQGAWLYFAADDGVHGCELWTTDGTAEGTVLVRDIHPGEQGSKPWSLVGFQGKLFFCAESPEYGEEVWVSDGTEEGTRLFMDAAPGPQSSGPNNLTVMNKTLFFTCDDGIYGEELWMSDGTPQGTSLAADIAPPRHESTSRPTQLTARGDKIFFVASDASYGKELWRSDGSCEGTMIVCDIVLGPADSSPERLVVAHDKVFFSADDGFSGRELWCSDGTLESTRLVRDILPGPDGSTPEQLVTLGDVLYFTANDGEHGRELWRSDGTREDTDLVQDITPGPTSTSIPEVFVFRDGVFCYIAEPKACLALWKVGPKGKGMERVLTIPDSKSPLDSDGTWALVNSASPSEVPAQDMYTILVSHPCIIGLIANNDSRSAPLVLGSSAFYVAYSDAQGAELWSTEGDPTSTSCISSSVYKGRCSSSPSHLTLSGGHAYFLADTREWGRTLWRTPLEGGECTPVNLSDEEGVSNPVRTKDIALANDKLFAAIPKRSRVGSERWTLGIMYIEKPRVSTDAKLTSSGEARLDDAVGIVPSVWHVLSSPCSVDWGDDPQLTAAGNRTFFVADDGIHGEELWVTDGTTSGTRLVKDILIPGGFQSNGK